MLRSALLGLVLVVTYTQCQQRFIELPFDDEQPTRRDFANEQHFQTFQQRPVNIPQPQLNPTHRFSHQDNAAPHPEQLFTGHDFAPAVPKRFPSQIRGNVRHLTTPSPPPLPILRAVAQPQEHFEEPTVHFEQQQFPSRPVQTPSRFSLSEQEIQTLNSVSQPQRLSQTPSNAFFSIEEPTLRAAQHSAPSHKPHIRRPQPIHVPQAPRFVPPPQPQFIINEQPTATFEERPQPVQPKFQPASFGSDLTGRQKQDYEEKLFRQQAANAKYSFASQIDDSISGNQHQREEMRDGLAVKGKYSYSDGYVKRTVHYEADDKGYRVVKEEEEPLGDGPQVDPNGHANVSTFVAGNQVQYSITGADIQDQQKNFPPQTQQSHRPLRNF